MAIDPYRLDRTKFKMKTFKEADNHGAYWKKKSLAERLQAAFYLNSIAFNFDINHPPRINKQAFSMRKLKNEEE